MWCFRVRERHIKLIQLLHSSGPSEAVRHGGGRRTKNLQGEREREGGKKERKRKTEREEKKERKGEESKRERCIRPMGVKHPLRTGKRLYKTQKEGAEER